MACSSSSTIALRVLAREAGIVRSPSTDQGKQD